MKMSSSTNSFGDQTSRRKSEGSRNETVSTLHRIYRNADTEDQIVIRDPANRRRQINRSAYARLHRSISSGSNRHSVDNLKGRFENLAEKTLEIKKENDNNDNPATDKLETPKEDSSTTVECKPVATTPKQEPSKHENHKILDGEVVDNKFTPASFGYPKSAKLVAPFIKPKPELKPKPVFKKQLPKDENFNVVDDDVQKIDIVLQSAISQESVFKIEKELSFFEMDHKGKDRKRNSFLGIFTGALFGKNKKKKEQEKNKVKNGDSMVHNDNIKNESHFLRQSPQRQTVQLPVNTYENITLHNQEIHEKEIKQLEQKYADLHVSRFKKIQQTFSGNKNEENVEVENSSSKPVIIGYTSSPVNRYIDTSSTTSTEPEKSSTVARETPPRAQETQQNFKIVKPKASIPSSLEPSLPSAYQNDKASPRTIDRNLDKSNGKDYPDKSDVTLGNDVVSTPRISLSPKVPQSPKSFETSKLKLPPNREIVNLQPRVKSPIPSNRVSTEKLIATELLKNNTKPLTQTKIAPKVPERSDVKPKPVSPIQVAAPVDQVVTSAIVHVPSRSETPVYNNATYHTTTPIELRRYVASRTSPQKEDIRKSVQEYYWKELKKMKEEEDSRFLFDDSNDYNAQNIYYDFQLDRARSALRHRAPQRSLSLPRDPRLINYVDYSQLPPQQAIPENQTLNIKRQVDLRMFVDNPNFRNQSNLRQASSTQKPIFRRGSLTQQELYQGQPYNKRVSFSTFQPQTPQWPTRNGYTQSPPQRRLERQESELEDDVFIRNRRSVEPIYDERYYQDPSYNRSSEQYSPNYQNYRILQSGSRIATDSGLVSPDQIYISRNQALQRPGPNVPEAYGRPNYVSRFNSNSQLSLARSPVYSSRQSMADGYTNQKEYQAANPMYSPPQTITDNNYGQRQVTIRNKYADMYGRIHDLPQSGVVMGQLQSPPVVARRPQSPQPVGFVRGTRLTASANDVDKRNHNVTHGYKSQTPINYDKRPLPPIPTKKRPPTISDTESGSDVSEILRITQSKAKNSSRGLFGK